MWNTLIALGDLILSAYTVYCDSDANNHYQPAAPQAAPACHCDVPERPQVLPPVSDAQISRIVIDGQRLTAESTASANQTQTSRRALSRMFDNATNNSLTETSQPVRSSRSVSTFSIPSLHFEGVADHR